MTAAMPMVLADGTADAQIYTGAIRLMGWSLHESAGTPAVASLIIRDGTAATAPIVAVLEFAANASDSQWFGPDGLIITAGVFVDRTAGSTEGAVYIA